MLSNSDMLIINGKRVDHVTRDHNLFMNLVLITHFCWANTPSSYQNLALINNVIRNILWTRNVKTIVIFGNLARKCPFVEQMRPQYKWMVFLKLSCVACMRKNTTTQSCWSRDLWLSSSEPTLKRHFRCASAPIRSSNAVFNSHMTVPCPKMKSCNPRDWHEQPFSERL